MGLRNLTFAEAIVEYPGGTFAVRGVSPDMVVSLYNRHRGELSTVFDHFVSRAQGEEVQDVALMAGNLMATAPLVMAELIALASGSDPSHCGVENDEEGNPFELTDWQRDVDMARRMPLGTQVDALQKIAGQTFTSDMPPGKFFAVVIQAAATTTAIATPKN